MPGERAKREERNALGRVRREKLGELDPRGAELERIRRGLSLYDNVVDDRIVKNRGLKSINIDAAQITQYELQSHVSDNLQRPVTANAIRDLNVTEPKLATNSGTSRVIQSHATDNTLRGVITDAIRDLAITGPKVAVGAITGGVNAAGTSPTGKLALDTVVSANILPGEVGPRAIWDNLQSAFFNDYYTDQLRRIGGSTGVAYTASSSDHFHSISFKHLTEEAQDAAIALREKLRAPGVALDEVRDMVLILCHLLFDDPEESAEEHKERRKQGKKRDGEREDLHDYGTKDKEGKPIMEHRRRGRFGRENHPDISKHIRKSV